MSLYPVNCDIHSYCGKRPCPWCALHARAVMDGRHPFRPHEPHPSLCDACLLTESTGNHGKAEGEGLPVFEPTGEVRAPKKGDFVFVPCDMEVVRATFDWPGDTDFPIYRRREAAGGEAVNARPVTHIAGRVAMFDGIQRQRCAWCGDLMLNDDLRNMAVAGEDKSPPRGFEEGALVRVDATPSGAGTSYVTIPGRKLPDDACLLRAPSPAGETVAGALTGIVLTARGFRVETDGGNLEIECGQRVTVQKRGEL